ncbi:hypothetical protein BJ546DRAFT_1058850 [Cryomyces antarcticus]|nr:hypothetical protein LTR60_001833 [Cryomyces antarcticus]
MATRRSLEYSRPILASTHASFRFSTYSTSPSVTTTTSLTSGDPRTADIKSWSAGFDRLDDQRYQQQRYVPSPGKYDDMSKLALGAKVERALGRRMTGQDAAFRPKVKAVNEKVA